PERVSGEGRKLARGGVSCDSPFSVKGIFELFLYMQFSLPVSTRNFRLSARPVFSPIFPASTICSALPVAQPLLAVRFLHFVPIQLLAALVVSRRRPAQKSPLVVRLFPRSMAAKAF
ncbi:MAG: hypothetical protein ACRD51_10465, partial [Candidatus Acidiferrum sp.]